MLEHFVHWLLDRFRDVGYPGIVVLMAIESSILPLPSELVMPPAGYLAAKGEMSFALAIACGVLGSILGALANYGLALWLGRAFVRRVGRYVLVSERSLDRSERFFADHGEISTFLARMLPVVRHLISLPAGLARMPLQRFVLFTGLGAAVWCTRQSARSCVPSPRARESHSRARHDEFFPARAAWPVLLPTPRRRRHYREHEVDECRYGPGEVALDFPRALQ